MVSLLDNARVLVIKLDQVMPTGLDEAACHSLFAELKAGEEDPTVSAIVLAGEEKTFFDRGCFCDENVSSSTVEAFGNLIEKIDACAKPVVAAIQGQARNHGLELALACHARVSDASAQVGFDYIDFGLIPGSGGTQRLPRLIGMDAAFDLIQSGRIRTVHELKKSGLFDLVSTDGSRKDVERIAQELASQLAASNKFLRTRDRTIDPMKAESILDEKFLKLNSRQQLQSVYPALKEVLLKASGLLEDGLSKERELFKTLSIDSQSRALCHQYKAEQEAVQMPVALCVSPREIRSVAVIGAGTMGTGIAIAVLDAGYEVILVEQSTEALERGRIRIQAHYKDRVASGKMVAIKAADVQQRLLPTTDWQLISRADLVIEAVFEELGVKQKVFIQLDAVAKPGAILATNTSYLDLDAIADVTSRPHDVIGLHFFSPANVMKLVEVIRGAHTSPEILATGMEFGRKLNKVPVLCGNAFGFIGNRIYNAYRKQCEFMLEDGAWPEEVDQAITGLGFAMGPFSVADLSGLDIAWRMRKAQAATRDPRERYVPILDRLCEQGRLGRKTELGYYSYQNGVRNQVTDAVVRAVIENARSERGITPRTLDPVSIQRRALLAMVNEAALLLSENVAARAGDIDVVMVQGYGFPRWLGGPVFWAHQQDRSILDKELDRLIAESGFGAVRSSSAMVDALLA